MEEQLKEYLVEFIEMLKQGGQFVLDQAPLFIHEYLTYYTAYHIFWSIICISVFIGFSIFWYKFNKKFEWNDDNIFFSSMAGIFIWLPSLLFGFEQITYLLKITLAPRLYLIENLLDLI